MKRLNQCMKTFLAVCLLLAAGAALAADAGIARIVTTGEGTASAPPDMAVMSLTVNREAETARAALDANSAAMEEVIAALREAGIPAKDMQTSGFSIQPRYTYPKARDEAPPRISGYSVRNSLSVNVRDLALLGALLDRTVSLGINEGGNIRFANADPTALLERAREAAVADALARARTIARAAGVQTGRLLEISESGGQPEPRPMLEGMAMARAADAVPLATGENTYRVAVTISVEIAQ